MAGTRRIRIFRRSGPRRGAAISGQIRVRQSADWDGGGPVAARPSADAVQRACAECAKDRAADEDADRAVLSRQAEAEEEQAQPMLARQAEEEEEEAQPKLARQAEEEEEEAQPKLARQAEEEEEETQPKLARQAEEEEEEAAQTKLARQAEEEEEAAQTKKVKPPLAPREPPLARAPAEAAASGRGDASPAATPVSAQLRQARGGGNSLDAATRDFMESRFSRDLGQVRVHTDQRADALNRRLQARAFTNGKDIYFRGGHYDTSRSDGLKLLAHELTHVVQQRGDLVPRVQRQPAPAPAPAPACPKPEVKVKVYPILKSATLADAFGISRGPLSKVTFTSLLQREKPNGGTCGADGKSQSWDLCIRRAVINATMPVDIDINEISSRGPNGERWYQDCKDALPTPRFVTAADARAGMTSPRPLTVAGVRRHELYHVAASTRLLKQRLEARNDHHVLCPYDSAAIKAWRDARTREWASDAEAFLRTDPMEPNEEANAVRQEC